MSYQHLIHLPWSDGKQNCYSLVRAFYDDVFGIKLDEFQIPSERWWQDGHDLFMQNYHSQGFILIDVSPREIQFGDVFLIAPRGGVANHCGVYVGDGYILHHFWKRTSETTMFRGIWKNQCLALLRHKDLMDSVPHSGTTDIKSLLSEGKRRLFDEKAAQLS